MAKKTQLQKAYEALRKAILDQELKPGYPIIEEVYAEKFKISRTPLRDAIRRLEADGLVEIIPRKGAFIRSFTKREILMVYEVAEALEGMAAYIVAKSVKNGTADNEKILNLSKLVESMEIDLENRNMEAWATSDDIFHKSLGKLSGNEHLQSHLDKIHAQLNSVLWFLTPFHIDKQMSNTEHREIAEAILRGDPETARTAAQRQRNRVHDELEKILT